MSEQERDKAGLHKEISSIFKGVPIPQTDGGQEPSGTPAPEHIGCAEPKPPAPEPQKPCDASVPERTGYTEPKPPTPEPQKPCDAPVPGRTGYTAPKQPTPEPQKPCDASVPERTGYTEPKQPTPEPQKPCDTPVPERISYTAPKQPTPEPQKPCDAPVPERTGYTAPKPPTPKPCDAPVPERTGYTEPKPPTPEPQKPKAPKPYKDQVMQSAPKSTGARQPKADINDIEKKVSRKPAIVKSSSQTFRQQITNKLFPPKPGVGATRQKAMVVIVPLLFIVLIFMLRGVFGTGVRKTKASAEDSTASVTTAGLNTKIDWEIPAPYPTTLRDPMRLGPVATAQTGNETRTFVKLIVKGILYTEDNPSAVIGSQIMYEGEEIQGVTIVKISKDSVEFEMNGKRWTQKVR